MENTNDSAYLWILHGDTGGKPGICDWAKTEAEAESKLTALRAEQAQSKFWSQALSAEEAEQYKQIGLLPPGA